MPGLADRPKLALEWRGENVRAREAPLGHESYWSAEAFAREEAALFRRCWLFAGPAADFGEEPRAVTGFGRGVAIAREPGGWRGVEDGRPIAVAACGDLVFYRLGDDPRSLLDYLHPYAGDLAEMSRRLGPPDHRDRVTVAANWKTLVENTLDDLHPAFVHRETLFPSMEKEGEARSRLDRQGRHSLLENQLDPRDLDFWTKLETRLPLARYGEGTGYRHLFVFPNFYASSFYGAMVLLHRVDPLEPESAALDWTLHLPLAEGRQSALHRAILRDQTQKARKVIDEDMAICLAAQRGRHFASLPALLGDAETRLLDFQEAVGAAPDDTRP